MGSEMCIRDRPSECAQYAYGQPSEYAYTPMNSSLSTSYAPMDSPPSTSFPPMNSQLLEYVLPPHEQLSEYALCTDEEPSEYALYADGQPSGTHSQNERRFRLSPSYRGLQLPITFECWTIFYWIETLRQQFFPQQSGDSSQKIQGAVQEVQKSKE